MLRRCAPQIPHFSPVFMGLCPDFPQFQSMVVRLQPLYPASYISGCHRQGRIKVVWGPWLKLRKGPLSTYI